MTLEATCKRITEKNCWTTNLFNLTYNIRFLGYFYFQYNPYKTPHTIKLVAFYILCRT